MKHDNQLLRLDIACGKNKKPGFTGVDIWEGADIVVDLEKFPWPFEDNSVDEVFCSHYVEHTPDLISFANELYRILKVGSKAEILAPYYSSIRAWQDPTHVRAISENTFLYFDKKWRLFNLLDHYSLAADFDFTYKYILSPEWTGRPEEETNFAIRYYINVVSDIHAVLTKRMPCDDSILLSQIASECWETGDFMRSIALYDQLVSQNKADSATHLKLAEYAFKNTNYIKAIDSFKQALENAAAHDDADELFQAHLGLVRSLYMAGLTKKAELHIQEIRESDSELADLIIDFVAPESGQAISDPSPGLSGKPSKTAILATLKSEYTKACAAKSDIYRHLPVLYDYAKKCRHVTEMGSRTGVSSRAFLYANPGTFVSYDYQYATPEPHLEKDVQTLKALFDRCRESGINCTYIGKNVLEVEIEETDMLFLDTYHCYAQLKKELELHAGKVRRYISFHDTVQFGVTGEGFPVMDPNHPVHKSPLDGSGGIRKAINEFLQAHKEWKIVHESNDSNGLIIIQRKQQRNSRIRHAGAE